MVSIKVTATNSYASGLPPYILDTLKEELSYTVLGGEYSDKYNEGSWDGRCYLITDNGTFGTGFLDRVISCLNQNSIPHNIVDRRPNYPRVVHPAVGDAELRPYQVDIVNTIIAEKRLQVHAVPRSGKTLCARQFLLSTSSFPSLFLCQSLDLAYQTANVFQGFDVGIVGDGHMSIGQHLTVATIQSYRNALNVKKDDTLGKDEKQLSVSDRAKLVSMLKLYKSVIVDEAHHAASATYQALLRQLTNAEYFVGLSGTPFREDNKDLLLERYLGPIKCSIGYSQLIDLGYLVPPYIYLYNVPRVSYSSKVYSSIYKEAIVDNAIRNGVIARVADSLFKLNESVVIIVSRKNHGVILQQLLCSKYNINAHLLYGTSDTDIRKTLIDQINSNQKIVVISTLLKEGIDLPPLKNVIIACGGESAIDVFQRFRNMTPYPGKTFCRTIDFIDNTRYIGAHSLKRARLYSSERGFHVIKRLIKD